MSSTNDAGGITPAPLHVIWPLPQSPVSHVNLPDESVVHCVLPQNLPDHSLGASIENEALEASSKPVVDNCALPAAVKVPGHTVNGQLFVNVNVAD